MKILIYGINYAPEMTGIGKYSGEMGAFMASQGHDVEVITAPPYYPDWSVAPSHRGKGWFKETIGGVRVCRVPLYVPDPKNVSGLKRILHEFSFLVSSLRYWLPRLFRKYDVIICVSPPFHLGVMGVLHKLVHGTTVVNHIQDLQVDAARNLGIINNEALLRLLEWLEVRLLRGVSLVSTISEGMLRKISAKGIPPEKLVLFPNWVDASVVFPLPPEQSLRAEWGFSDTDKIVLYSGNLGEKQGLGYLLDLAEAFLEQRHVHFVIVGNGGTKEQLVADAERRNLSNVIFKPLQPLAKLAACLSAADVHLVLQRKEAADLVMPSKLTNILAVNGHALITAEPGTTLHDVVVEHRLGTVVAAEDGSALRAGLTRILAGECAGDTAGAIDYARHVLNKQATLNTFLAKLSIESNTRE